ncbi:MAG: ribosome biogenesis GTP-binding protein YsxC [Deltaproteobacteria bacterium]|nr:ribosome biogenesis GTP-binding protein YsxC [Deltaproteobacteria bacterium]
MEVSFLKSATLPEQFPPADRPEVAFAGRSNVGKSSLINRLINSRNLARTSSRPGRTRSINFFSAGKTLYLTDLPGYGYAEVPLNVRRNWKKHIETYLKKRANLKAVVVIIDVRRKLGEGDLDLLNWLKMFQIKPIIVNQLLKEGFGPPIAFSAKTGQGKQELWKKINEIVKLVE